MTRDKNKRRPRGISALSVFFFFGALASFLSFVSLLFPGSFLEPLWRLNPRARAGFSHIGVWAIVLMGAVCVACVAAGIGLWRGARWGHRLAITLIAINLIGDLANAFTGVEPRAIVGVPIASAILLYLASNRVRLFFVD